MPQDAGPSVLMARPRPIPFAANRPYAWLTFAYIPLLLMFGGGGSPAPLAELLCQALAAFTLLAWIWLQGPASVGHRPALYWAAGLIVAVPAIQLVPLPPGLWQALPGRDLLRETLALIGKEDTWRPLSVAPQRTAEALLSLLPPMLAMILVAGLSRSERFTLLKIIGGFALLSVAVGAAQLASSGWGPLHFYTGGEPGVLFGFQANRNAQVDVILIGALAAIAAWHVRAKTSRGAAGSLAAVVLVMLLGAVLTGSRAGIALAPLALAWCVSLQPWRLPADSPLRQRSVPVLGAIALAGLIAAVLQSRSIGRVLERFDFTGEYRPEIWRDTVYAIGQYWPLGSGMGTFTRVIGPAERLEAIGPTLPNRAHSEYLELLLEAGLPGALAWFAVAVLVIIGLRKALRSASPGGLPQAVFAGGALTIVTLHSLVDYPLRSMALAGLVGVAAAFVLAPPKVGEA